MFVRGPNPIWFMNNLTGATLDDTYYAFFNQNTIPYLPQPVYQTPNGTPWSNPLEFQVSGGLPNNLYFDPNSVYQIIVRKGSDNSSPLIWQIDNYVPEGAGGTNVTNQFYNAQNLITNPQFADLYFGTSTTIAAAGTYFIGPGWQLVLTGSGTTTLTQVAVAGSSDLPGNPPYYLQIANSGWTSAILLQQFNNNGALFQGGSVSASILANSVGSATSISINYVPSHPGGSSTGLIGFNPLSVPVGSLAAYTGYANIPVTDNPDTGTSAYVQFAITLPNTGTLQLSNIQFIGQSQELSDGFDDASVLPFQETSYERIEDQEFHVYKNSIVIQPKSSIVTGWSFALNPWQFSPTALTPTASKCYYTADQTIYYQRTNSANNVGAATYANNFGYQVQANSTSGNQFAIIQYIAPNSMKPYWGSSVSSLVKAKFSTSGSGTMKIKMRLIYQSSLPSDISSTEPIASWSGPGTDPVFSTAWTVITPPLDPVFTLGSSYEPFAFNNIQLPLATSSSETLGIVIYTYSDMSSSTTDSVFIESVSLVPNQFAIDYNPLTFDETLKACQYYYEMSYQSYADFVTASTFNNCETIPCGLTNTGTLQYVPYSPIYLRFRRNKCKQPVMTFYSPNSGSSGNIFGTLWNNNTNSPTASSDKSISFWTVQQQSMANYSYNDSYILIPNVSGNFGDVAVTNYYYTGFQQYHYTADARLGLN